MIPKPSIPETIPVSCNKDCAAGCPLLAHVEDGRIVKITNNFPEEAIVSHFSQIKEDSKLIINLQNNFGYTD